MRNAPYALLAVVLVSGVLSGPARAQGSRAPRGDLGLSYLLLVNTAIASRMDDGKLRQFDRSPYDGLAVAFLHAYDTGPVPSPEDMAGSMRAWRGSTEKHIWPWVYVNRMIGFAAAEHNEHSDAPYFRAIAGADLDGRSGARSDFLLLWRNALSAARQAGSPGVVCDLEFYNDHRLYDIASLAGSTGKKPSQAAKSLEDLGAEMARIVEETYPDAFLWFLFTGFTHPGYKTYDGTPYYPSPTYVAIGLLDEISRRRVPARVLTGGEGSLAYCHENLAALGQAIEKRRADSEPALAKYAGVLEMAGTLTLWSEQSAKRGWVSEGACGTAAAASVEELRPYLELLLRSYRYNWIYASGDGNYLAFSPESAPRFDRVIAQARSDAGRPRSRP